MPKTPEQFKLVLESMPGFPVEPILRLRQGLKYLRRHGLKCTRCTTVIPPKKSPEDA